ncbi:MAG TPA: hypothetical protein VG713_00500, partial [Pirellulales bacterium]|nr:hypothetical protein [Pirellulales bacterium]
RRYFHCPTGLGVGDQLWLIVAEARGVKAIVLNDSPLECSRPDTTIALPITAHVAERNLLTLDLAPLDDQAGAAWSDVLLEIRPAESR